MWLASHPCRPVPPQLWAGGQTGGRDTHSVKVYDAWSKCPSSGHTALNPEKVTHLSIRVRKDNAGHFFKAIWGVCVLRRGTVSGDSRQGCVATVGNICCQLRFLLPLPTPLAVSKAVVRLTREVALQTVQALKVRPQAMAQFLPLQSWAGLCNCHWTQRYRQTR